MLQVFNFDETTAIRTSMVGDAVWFMAADIATALDYAETSKALLWCKQSTVQGDVNKISNLHPSTKWIPESDMYRLIMKSTKAEAEKFQDWVCEEVLPTIRKTGGYAIVKPKQDFELAKQTGLLSPAYVDMAKAFGFEGNQAYLSADKAIKQITGYSPLSLLGAELVSPIQAAVLVPSDIADRLGLKRQEPNKLLTAQGFQTNHRNHKDAIYYELTEKGKQCGEYVDTGLKHSDGSPRKQIKWFSTILEVLQTGEK